jgi:hypothetical protein
MTINTFLTNYWIYIAALGLAIWNVYLHFKANKVERKKNLQTAYMQLTGIINDFQVDCLKHFHLEPEVMNLKLKVAEDIDNAMEVLKNVGHVKKTTLLEKKDEFVNTLAKLKEDYERSTDESLKNKLREDIKLKIADVKLLIKDFEDESSKNEPFLDKARDIQKLAKKKLLIFHENMPQRVISISEAAINLTNNLNSASAWQLTASKSIVKIINELESSASKLNLRILKSVTDEGEKVHIETIVRSDEFRIIWELSQKAITKMRSEIL